jgi:hypothetical protein
LMTPKSPLYRKNAFSLASLHLAQTKGDHVYCWLLERLKRSLVFITHLTCSLAGLHLAHAQAMDKSRNETTATSVLRYHRQYLAAEARCSHAGQGKRSSTRKNSIPTASCELSNEARYKLIFY